MLLRPGLEFAYFTDNYSGANPLATMGAVVTTGASSGDGTAVALIATPLTYDCEMLEIGMHSNNDAGVDSSTLVDILIDPAGGTAWQDFILSLPAGFIGTGSTVTAAALRSWTFPVKIPAGSTIGVRGRNTTVSTRAVTVFCMVRGGPLHNSWWCGQRVDPIGDIRATSRGANVPPNASANTFGAWTSIGSATARAYRALVASVQGEGTTMVVAAYYLQVGISSVSIGPTFALSGTNAEVLTTTFPVSTIYRRIPEGTQLQARIMSTIAGQDTLQVILHGVA